MNISFSKQEKIFKIDTLHTTLLFAVGPSGELRKIYYGKTVPDFEGTRFFTDRTDKAFSPSPEGTPSDFSPDIVPMEFSAFGSADFRITGHAVRTPGTACVTMPVYKSCRILRSKKALAGLPSSFGDKVQTLEITLEDPATRVEWILSWSVFSDSDVIARSVRIVNKSKIPVFVEKAASAQLDFPFSDLEMVYLHGHWAAERSACRIPLHPGRQSFGSVRGATGHQYNPSLALVSPDATERSGEAYAMLLLYSGNYLCDVEVDQFGATRALIGINPEGFSWQLAPGESFQTPEALIFYSAEGLGGLSRISHKFLMDHVIRSPWKHKKRPILINNWEGTYFDFTGDRIYHIAEDASKLGIEMLVLDDGWFGHRNDDHTSLGDWFVNRKKVGDLGKLVEKINRLGMKFGLWFEPEMISVDSKLYEQHPDWVLQIPDHPRSWGRRQLVLDMSRNEVVDYLFKTISSVLESANIEYIKWDMNRNLTEVYSKALPPEKQGEVFHRFMLGTYSLHERLLKRFPYLLIEGCSGGGGRFDAGMLYYAPQIWCSDDSDAIQRVAIQMGTSLFYPCSSMGAHVSVCPNHQTHRTVPFMTRASVALAGTFGYELDVTKLSPGEKDSVKEQIAMYHRYADLIREGAFYRLTENFGSDSVSAWMWVDDRMAHAFVTVVRKHAIPCSHGKRELIRLQGLDPKAFYSCEGRTLSGEFLMNAGIVFSGADDASAMNLELTKISK